MADASNENTESSAEGSHKLKLMLDDKEIVSVSVGLQVLGKAAGGSTDWMGEVKDYLKSSFGLDKLLGSSKTDDTKSAEGSDANASV